MKFIFDPENNKETEFYQFYAFLAIKNKNNINFNGYTMYAKFSDGTLVPMSLDNDVCKINDYEMKVNSILTNFVLKSKSDTKTIRIDKNVIFNRSINITMEISNDDVAHRTN